MRRAQGLLFKVDKRLFVSKTDPISPLGCNRTAIGKQIRTRFLAMLSVRAAFWRPAIGQTAVRTTRPRRTMGPGKRRRLGINKPKRRKLKPMVLAAGNRRRGCARRKAARNFLGPQRGCLRRRLSIH